MSSCSLSSIFVAHLFIMHQDVDAYSLEASYSHWLIQYSETQIFEWNKHLCDSWQDKKCSDQCVKRRFDHQSSDTLHNMNKRWDNDCDLLKVQHMLDNKLMIVESLAELNHKICFIVICSSSDLLLSVDVKHTCWICWLWSL